MSNANAVYLRLLRKHGGLNSDGTPDATGQLFRRAFNGKDIDRLLTYENLLDEGLLAFRLQFADTVVDYLRRNRYKNIASFLTDEHLRDLNNIEGEILLHSPLREMKVFDPRHDPLRNLMVDNFAHSGEIIHIVKSNRTIDPEAVRRLLEERLEHHSSIRGGTL